VESAEHLFNARKDSIAIMKKNEKQQEIANLRDEFRVLTDDDGNALVNTALVDFFTTLGVGKLIGYATVAVSSSLPEGDLVFIQQ
jgi:hypothetical protein